MTTPPSILSVADLEVGTTIDRYEVVRHVARGGMGSVWLARFTGKHGFEKLVAIKTIRPELAQDTRFRAMFLDEARLTSRLSHANIAQVLDVGEHETLAFIVFEWVDGTSLEQVCAESTAKRDPLAIDFLLRRMAEVCAGLHAAHELKAADGGSLGIVHRDVSPMNVMISREGFAKVIDFGVAKARDRVAPETRSGIVKGTPQYMAPEQAMGRDVDRRADVWSVGATLHRALAGVPPFADREDLAAFLGGAALVPLPDSIPSEVREVVQRALRLDPAKRFSDAEEMRVALEGALHAVRGRSAHAVLKEASRAAPTAIEGEVSPALAPTQLDIPKTPPAAPRETAMPPTHRALIWGVVLAGFATIAAAAFSYCG